MGIQGLQRAALILVLFIGIGLGWVCRDVFRGVQGLLGAVAEPLAARTAPPPPDQLFNFQNPVR